MKSKINTGLIQNYINKNNLTKTKFCETCKISYKTFTKIMNNQDNLYFSAIYKISKVMGIYLVDMFV